MTIEIADRLVKLRKAKGLSQEELADKLGLSRQAVSKWERAEASPDTDNLICLAKLYSVSLDELLSTDEDIDTIVNEQVKNEDKSSEESKQEFADDTKKETKEKSIHIGKNGIHLDDDEGNTIDIDKTGIHLKDKNNNHKHIVPNQKKNKGVEVANILEGILCAAVTVLYIVFGAIYNTWWNGWCIFFLPDIIASIIRAIAKKRFCEFNMAFVALFTFFFVCMVHPGLSAGNGGLWHPMWVVFVAFPMYYVALGPIDKLIHKNDVDVELKDCCKVVGESDAEVIDSKDDEDDED